MPAPCPHFRHSGPRAPEPGTRMYVLGSPRQERIQDGRRLPVEHPQLAVGTAVGDCKGRERQGDGQGQREWSQIQTHLNHSLLAERHFEAVTQALIENTAMRSTAPLTPLAWHPPGADRNPEGFFIPDPGHTAPAQVEETDSGVLWPDSWNERKIRQISEGLDQAAECPVTQFGK